MSPHVSADQRPLTSTSSSFATRPESTRLVPPPSAIQHDELTPVERGRVKSLTKRVFSLRRRKSLTGQASSEENPSAEARPSDDIDSTDERPVAISSGLSLAASAHFLDADSSQDIYQWAVLYENQRGVTFFSTPYYSRLSLLPIDPPAFTVPSANKTTRRHHPSVSLTSYPLPDGDWRWVSQKWMVDMRSEGQTQYDGFEYNWFFRRKHWRPQVGPVSMGGWVRRRRWVRLMVRPAQSLHHSTTERIDSQSLVENLLYSSNALDALAGTRPPSIAPSISEKEALSEQSVWRGHVDDDWERCRRIMRHNQRDGRKLELWHGWLQAVQDQDVPFGEQGHNTTSQERSVAHESIPRESICAVLRHYGTELLQSFMYPESRAEFLRALAHANLLGELDADSGGHCSVQPLCEFWSSSCSLRRILEESTGTAE